MRYFFLALTLITILVVSFFGFRGDKFSSTPIRLFPDMDDQDKVRTQTTSAFFADGMSARKPVAGAVPRGFESDGSGPNFGNNTSYYHPDKCGKVYGDGMPKALKLNADNTEAFIRHGKQRYNISCMPCHGEAGNGRGTAAVVGNFSVADLNGFLKAEYPDGQMYETISVGKGLMSGYAYNIPVRDRWAIIAYVRALQTAVKSAE